MVTWEFTFQEQSPHSSSLSGALFYPFVGDAVLSESSCFLVFTDDLAGVCELGLDGVSCDVTRFFGVGFTGVTSSDSSDSLLTFDALGGALASGLVGVLAGGFALRAGVLDFSSTSAWETRGDLRGVIFDELVPVLKSIYL